MVKGRKVEGDVFEALCMQDFICPMFCYSRDGEDWLDMYDGAASDGVAKVYNDNFISLDKATKKQIEDLKYQKSVPGTYDLIENILTLTARSRNIEKELEKLETMKNPKDKLKDIAQSMSDIEI